MKNATVALKISLSKKRFRPISIAHNKIMYFRCAHGNKIQIKKRKNEVVTYSKVANAERAASCTHLLLLRIHLSKIVNTISNWTCPSIAYVITYKQKEE
jgi:hypothetical protein